MLMQTEPRDNHLLGALPGDAWQRVAPHMEYAPLVRGQAVYGSGEEISHAYFPTSAIVSMMYFTDNGASSESAVVGNDGMVGIALLMGGGSMSSHAVVQGAGEAYRMPAQVLMSEFRRGGATMQLLLRYTQALLTQIAQRAVCNRHHSLAQQLARCLLLSLDRNPGREILTTQEVIANRLGVRREGVTEGAYFLQKLGLIRYTRGRITVLDREGLESRACECYAVVKQECNRLLPGSDRHSPEYKRWMPERRLERPAALMAA